MSALTVETADPIDTRGTVETSGSGAIVNVHRTVLSGPAVDANAVVRAQGIGAGCSVVADARAHGTLVHVHLARIASPLRRARTRVTVHVVHARAAVETGVWYAVVDVLLAVFPSESWEKKKR